MFVGVRSGNNVDFGVIFTLLRSCDESLRRDWLVHFFAQFFVAID